MSYNKKDTFIQLAETYQSVPSYEEAKKELIVNNVNENDIEIDTKIEEYRLDSKYTSNDSYQMGIIQDRHIFVSTTDPQHQQIMNGEVPIAHVIRQV